MMKRSILAFAALSAPAFASAGPISASLDGFRSEQTDAVIYRNPAEALGADPRFEPEQRDPAITIQWTRDGEGHLWADVVYRNPDTGIYAVKNERFEFAERTDGDWDMIGRWSRWKCLGASADDWTIQKC